MPHTQHEFANHTMNSCRRFHWIPSLQCPPCGPRTNAETYEGQHSANKASEVQKRTFGSAATHIQRNPAYSELNSDDVSHFKTILGDNGVVQDEDRITVANVDWMGKYKGASQLLLLPKNTVEVFSLAHYLKIQFFECQLAAIPFPDSRVRFDKVTTIIVNIIYWCCGSAFTLYGQLSP